MDFPVSWTPSMLMSSDMLEAVGHTQPPIVTVEHTTTTSMAEPANPMERTLMLSSGVAPSVAGDQIGLLSAQSIVMSMAPSMPSNESYSPTTNEVFFDVGQNLPYVGQPVPALNQSTVPGTQMGHSEPSMNENSSNRLVIPDLSRSMTRTQQLGVSNNTTVDIHQYQSRSDFSIIYEGDLFLRTESQPLFITRVEGFRERRMSEVFSVNWPRELQIVRLFHFHHTSFRNCTRAADFVVFRAMTGNVFLRNMQEHSFCALIELTFDMMFLIVIDEVRLVGVVCPYEDVLQLEQLLRGMLHEDPNNQIQVMSRLLYQDSLLFHLQVGEPRGSGPGYPARPYSGLYTAGLEHQLFQYQWHHVSEIQNRQELHESLEQQRLRQEFLNQLHQQPLFSGLQWQRRVQEQSSGLWLTLLREQALRNHPLQQETQQRLLEGLQQQGEQQQERSLQQQEDQALPNHLQQQERRQQLPGLSLQQRAQALHNPTQRQEIQQRMAGELQQQGQQQQQLPGRSLQQQRDHTSHNHIQQQEMQQRVQQHLLGRLRPHQFIQAQLNRILHQQMQQRELQKMLDQLVQPRSEQALNNFQQQQEIQERLSEELQQQGQQLQQLPGQSLQQSQDQALHDHPQQEAIQQIPLEELAQQGQQQEQLHQEQQRISTEQPTRISEFEWFRRVRHFLERD